MCSSRAARHSLLSSKPGIDGGLAAKLKILTSFKLPGVDTAAATTTAAASVHGSVGINDQQLTSPSNSNSSSVPLPLAAKLGRAEATLAEGWDSVEASVDGMLARARASGRCCCCVQFFDCFYNQCRFRQASQHIS
jgi:hypothetical protein